MVTDDRLEWRAGEHFVKHLLEHEMSLFDTAFHDEFTKQARLAKDLSSPERTALELLKQCAKGLKSLADTPDDAADIALLARYYARFWVVLRHVLILVDPAMIAQKPYRGQVLDYVSEIASALKGFSGVHLNGHEFRHAVEHFRGQLNRGALLDLYADIVKYF